jgi:hypothetical protein
MIVLMIAPVFAECGCEDPCQPPPCPPPCVPETGKITGGGQGDVAGADGMVPAGSFGFNVMWFSRDEYPKGELNYVDHIIGMHVHIHDMEYLSVWEDNPGNKPWPMLMGEFGGPCTIEMDGVISEGYCDVYIEDVKEPGKDDDAFLIWVSGSGGFMYTGGSDPILVGNIQIHKPPK